YRLLAGFAGGVPRAEPDWHGRMGIFPRNICAWTIHVGCCPEFCSQPQRWLRPRAVESIHRVSPFALCFHPPGRWPQLDCNEMKTQLAQPTGETGATRRVGGTLSHPTVRPFVPLYWLTVLLFVQLGMAAVENTD